MGRRVILASASPRRQELLKMIYPSFEVKVSQCTEETDNLSPAETVKELAKRKARSVAAEIIGSISGEVQDELIVIGSDTVVAVADTILGKPKNEENAFQMLKLLSGRSHSVYTGVAIVCVGQGKVSELSCEVFSERTEVKFVPMSDEEIRAYIGTGEPMDKAGAYGIQGAAGKYIASITGDYYNVVGLPVAALYQRLKKNGLAGGSKE